MKGSVGCRGCADSRCQVIKNIWFIYLQNMLWTTIDHFGSRWNNFKSKARKADSGSMENVKHQFLQSQFLIPSHKGFPIEVGVRLIDKIKCFELTKQEFYWMRSLKTFHPDCMFLSRHVCVSEWIHTLYLPQFQGTVRARNLKCEVWNLMKSDHSIIESYLWEILFF